MDITIKVILIYGFIAIAYEFLKIKNMMDILVGKLNTI
jgi:hypothetical protein